MKTKLLKKLRKRYEWTFSKDKIPILLDNWNKTATFYNVKYCCSRYKLPIDNLDDLLSCSREEWCLRTFKTDLLSKYGWSITSSNYKFLKRKLKNKK